MNPLGSPPPPPPRPTSWAKNTDSRASRQNKQGLKPGQIQFLKKIRDRPLTREDLDYYKDHQYYQELVGGDLEAFICLIEQDEYIERAGPVPEVWTCTAKGIEAAEKLILEARSNPSCLKHGLLDLNADESLKVATELKRDGNLNGAIEALLVSYDKISKSRTTYKVDTFLRLPNYLVLAGRFDEAWQYLNRLATKGYPSQLGNKALNILDKSKIYDSMSKFLHKERKHRQAVALKSMSLTALAQFHYLQSEEYRIAQEEDLREDSQRAFSLASRPEGISADIFSSIPKKARTLDLGEVVEYICIALRNPAQIKYDLMYIDIDRILAKQKGD